MIPEKLFVEWIVQYWLFSTPLKDLHYVQWFAASWMFEWLICESSEVDSGLVKLVVMINVFFNKQQHQS